MSQFNHFSSDTRLTDSLERELLQRAMMEEIQAQRAAALRAAFVGAGRYISRAGKAVISTLIEARKLQARAAMRSQMNRTAHLHGKAI